MTDCIQYDIPMGFDCYLMNLDGAVRLRCFCFMTYFRLLSLNTVSGVK